jgi:hypothetical protein
MIMKCGLLLWGKTINYVSKQSAQENVWN